MKKSLFGLLAFVAVVAVATPAFAQFRRPAPRAGVAPQAAYRATPHAAGAQSVWVGGTYVWYTCPFPTRPVYHPGGVYTYTAGYQNWWNGYYWVQIPVQYQVYVQPGVYCQ